MRKFVLAALLVFSQAAFGQASGRKIELLNNADGFRARASLDAGVPEDVVRGAYPNAFPKYGPSGKSPNESNDCNALARNPQVQAAIKNKLGDTAEPLNALADTPEDARPKELRPYYFYLRNIYERGNLAEQIKVRTEWEPAQATLRDYLPNGISCEVSVNVKMTGSVKLNKNYRGRADDGESQPIIPVELNYITAYEVKGLRRESGNFDFQIRGLRRMFK